MHKLTLLFLAATAGLLALGPRPADPAELGPWRLAVVGRDHNSVWGIVEGQPLLEWSGARRGLLEDVAADGATGAYVCQLDGQRVVYLGPFPGEPERDVGLAPAMDYRGARLSPDTRWLAVGWVGAHKGVITRVLLADLARGGYTELPQPPGSRARVGFWGDPQTLVYWTSTVTRTEGRIRTHFDVWKASLLGDVWGAEQLTETPVTVGFCPRGGPPGQGWGYSGWIEYPEAGRPGLAVLAWHPLGEGEPTRRLLRLGWGDEVRLLGWRRPGVAAVLMATAVSARVEEVDLLSGQPGTVVAELPAGCSVVCSPDAGYLAAFGKERREWWLDVYAWGHGTPGPRLYLSERPWTVRWVPESRAGSWPPPSAPRKVTTPP